jgi:hypothetical protein
MILLLQVNLFDLEFGWLRWVFIALLLVFDFALATVSSGALFILYFLFSKDLAVARTWRWHRPEKMESSKDFKPWEQWDSSNCFKLLKKWVIELDVQSHYFFLIIIHLGINATFILIYNIPKMLQVLEKCIIKLLSSREIFYSLIIIIHLLF